MSDTGPTTSNSLSSSATPWGFWATTGLGVAVLIAFLVIQSLVGIPFSIAMMAENPGMPTAELARMLNANAEYIAAALIATGTFGTLLVVACAWLRRGVGVRDYLAITAPGGRMFALWLAAIIVVMALLEAMTVLLGREGPEFVADLYANVRFPLLLALGTVIGAPLFEEVFFRGFLHAGWSRSRLGVAGTVLLTSLLWALMHIQYGIYEIAQIFALGVVLGVARVQSGSLVVPLAMHSLVNLIAHIQAMYMVSG